MENQAKSLTPRQSNFPAVLCILFLSLCCLCLVLHCLQEPCLILVLHWATAGRVDPRKACHLGKFSEKKQSWMFGYQNLIFTAASHGSHHLRKRFDTQGPEQHRSPNSDPSQTLLGKVLNKSNMKMHAKQKPCSSFVLCILFLSLCCLCLVLHCLQEPCLIPVLHWATAG